MNNKKLYCLIVVIFFTGKLFAQSITAPTLNKSLIPPSPEAASLGKYGIFPVALYSGMANVSVPLVELKSTKLSVSLALSYNYNGYRPGDEPGSIGLGWSLTGGGVITRIVQGKVDEDDSYLYHWKDFANITDISANQDLMELMGQGQIDGQPDLYTFSFNGHSGKFALVGDKAYMFPHQQLNISYDGLNFKIVDETGTTYYFQDKDTTTPGIHQPNAEFIPQYVSSWFLTKIISADYGDEIDFYYSKWIHSQRSTGYQDVYTSQSGGYKGFSTCTGLNSNCDVFTSVSYAGGSISANTLKKISSRNGYINLVADPLSRKDLNNPTAHALAELDVYDNSNILLKKVNLFHSYFGDSTNSLGSHLKLTGVQIQGFYNNKLLGSVSSNDPLTIPDYYSFQYYNENESFPKLTRGIDNWGYYNGRNNSMLFDGSFLGYNPLLAGADRSVDVSKSINGCLQKIIYPTGGYTTFDYENNMIGFPGIHRYKEIPKLTTVSATYTSGDSTIAGDVFTLNEEQTIQINYGRELDADVYPFGVFNSKRIVSIYDDNGEGRGNLLYSCPRLGKSITSNSDTFHLPSGLYHVIVTCESTSISSYATINYKWVDSTPYQGDPGPGLRIALMKSYDNINVNQPAMTKSYSYGLCTLLGNASSELGISSTIHHYATHAGGPGDYYGTSTITTYTQNYSSPLQGLLDNQFYYPIVTEYNNNASGGGKTTYEYMGTGDAIGILPIRQSDYSYKNGQFILLKQKATNYNVVGVANLAGCSYHLSEIVDPPDQNMVNSPLISPDPLDTIARYHLYELNPYSLSSLAVYTTSTDETSYDQDGNNPLTIHTDCYYDNPDHIQPTRLVTLNSKGDTVITQNKYPLDYPLASCGSLYSVDATFKSAQYNISATYQAAVHARFTALMQYYNPSTPSYMNSTLKAAYRSYSPNCENNYKSSYGSALSLMNVQANSFYSCARSNGLSNGSLSTVEKGIMLMKSQNMVAVPIEQIVSVKKPAGNEYLFGATKTDFLTNSLNGVNPVYLYMTKTGSSILKSDFLSNPPAYYSKEVNFKYDNYNNIKEQSKTNDLKTSYLWDYSNVYPIAQIVLPDQISFDDFYFFAYTSFESSNTGNWTIPSTARSGAAITGKQSFNLSNGNISASLDNTKTYIISYWAQTGASVSLTGAATPTLRTTKNGWTLYEAGITSSSSVTISGSGNIDELRLFPKNAQMTTYTYDPVIGVTSSCDPNGRISYYEYDPLGRLKAMRDADQNILKFFDYKFKIGFITYFNAQKSGTFTKTNCSFGQIGSSVTYSVPAGIYSSQVSQAAADALAQNDVNNNGPAYANANGTCSSNVTIQSTNFVGVSGFTAVYTNTSTNQQYSFIVSSNTGTQTLGDIPPGTYNLTISKTGNSVRYAFGADCNFYLGSGTSASFSNVSVSTTCHAIVIDSIF
jgi:YD repeat-containing protein